MAKKSRRSRTQSKAPVRKKPVSQTMAPVTMADRSVPARSAAAPASPAPAALQVQRRYVMTELRRIGVIAGLLIVILIVLSFVL